VKWAKDFDSFLPEKPLKDRSGKDIETFLADLSKRPGIADWQVRQAEHALKILYENLLPKRHHHDLHPRPEQARPLSKKPRGYLKGTKNNDVVHALRRCSPRLQEW
jgi:hypothetical protein